MSDRRTRIGDPLPRIEDGRLLSGGGRYTDDLVLDGMCFGYMLRTPHAHARIRSIDTEEAREAPGVLAILTGADLASLGAGQLPSPGGYLRPGGEPMYVPQTPVIATDKVRWVGDGVAFIVAETALQAQDAAELVSVEYEMLEPVVSPQAASATGAPLVWDDCPDNLCFTVEEGDAAAVDEAFAGAAHIVRRTFPISRVTAASMEPRGAIGVYEPDGQRYTFYSGIQRVHLFRRYLAEYILQAREAQVRVVSLDVGGSFGVKGALYHEQACVLLAARLVGRPVKWIASRSEAFLADAHGRDSFYETALALDETGRFLAMKVEGIAAVGAWLQPMMPAFAGNFGALAGVYRTPSIHLRISGFFTNTNPIGPYRGNGRPEASFIVERLIDLAAAQLGIDPAELRRRNYIQPDEMPFRTGLTFTYDSGAFEKSMDMALSLADYARFEERRSAARARGRRRGIGIGNVIERAAPSGYESAELRLDGEGALTVFIGSVSQGQGHETTFKQIASDRLGLSIDRIRFVQGDTDRVFDGEGTGGSRSAALGGSALLVAVDALVAKARPIGARLLQLDPALVRFRDGRVETEDGSRGISLEEIARVAAIADDAETASLLVTRARYRSQAPTFPNSCHVCEVEIDDDTGQLSIVRYVAVDDVGTVINPLLAEGQMHGGIAQGVGQVMMERIHFDESGQLQTGSFMDYAMPRASDMCSMETEGNAQPTATNPLGAKGAGEGGCVGAVAAVSNAVANALSDLGIDHIDMPITPESLWKRIREQG
ncbi:MAG: xanthine dehydrogenase family protein molybdopterin-binding subunit [Rhodospirillales bacterium]|nr:xanthine dehydrogenase family protein molybdopterin-binding subunit [Rhodospirillales bacterium]